MKKKNLHSEASMMVACQMLEKDLAYVSCCDVEGVALKNTEVGVWTNAGEKPLAIFELRDCYKLRKPLKGIKAAEAAIKAVIHPKKKKKAGK